MTSMVLRSMGVIGVVAAGIAMTALAAEGSPTRHPTVPRSINVPGTPLVIASGYGSIWVAGHDGTTLYRINPSNGRKQARIQENTNACDPMGVAFGRVWIDHCDTSTKDVVVGVRARRVVGGIDGLGLGFGFGSAWIDGLQQNPSIVMRVDPRTLRVLDRIRVGSNPESTISGGGFMWSVNWDDGTLSKIDPSSNAVVTTFRYGGPGPAFGVFTAGSLWILDVGDNALYRVDPRTQTAQRIVRTRFDSSFADPYLVVAARRIWLLTSSAGINNRGLVALDPKTNKILAHVRVPAGFGPYFAVTHGSVWGAQPMNDRVVRIPYPR